MKGNAEATQDNSIENVLHLCLCHFTKHYLGQLCLSFCYHCITQFTAEQAVYLDIYSERSRLYCAPYRMKVYTELNLATWLRIVVFTRN